MTDTFADTGRPPNTAIAWATPDGIFVEYPVKDGGPPYICRFNLNSNGLAAALNILIEHSDPTMQLVAKSHPAIKRQVGTGTLEQRAMASKIVRKMFK